MGKQLGRQDVDWIIGISSTQRASRDQKRMHKLKLNPSRVKETFQWNANPKLWWGNGKKRRQTLFAPIKIKAVLNEMVEIFGKPTQKFNSILSEKSNYSKIAFYWGVTDGDFVVW